MPHFSITITAVSSDSGMAVIEMHAGANVPSSRNTPRTRIPPNAQ